MSPSRHVLSGLDSEILPKKKSLSISKTIFQYKQQQQQQKRRFISHLDTFLYTFFSTKTTTKKIRKKTSSPLDHWIRIISSYWVYLKYKTLYRNIFINFIHGYVCNQWSERLHFLSLSLSLSIYEIIVDCSTL